MHSVLCLLEFKDMQEKKTTVHFQSFNFSKKENSTDTFHNIKKLKKHDGCYL